MGTTRVYCIQVVSSAVISQLSTIGADRVKLSLPLISYTDTLPVSNRLAILQTRR